MVFIIKSDSQFCIIVPLTQFFLLSIITKLQQYDVIIHKVIHNTYKKLDFLLELVPTTFYSYNQNSKVNI